MRATLLSVDPADPRPDPLGAEVIAAAAEPLIFPFQTWLREEGVSNTLTSEEQVAFLLKTALTRAKGLAWESARCVEDEFHMPMTLDGARLLEAACQNLKPALEAATARWALRTNIRFPAKTGERIEWVEPNGYERAGEVHGVVGKLAAAFCFPLDQRGYADRDRPMRVFAEQVYAIPSRGVHAGLRVTPRFDPVDIEFSTSDGPEGV